MNFKLFATFLVLICATFAIEQLPKEDEDKIVENYFQKFPRSRNSWLWRFRNAKENILRHFYEVQEHNERYRNGEDTYEMELNELSALSDETLAETRLGYMEQSSDDFSIHEDNNTIASAIQSDFRASSASIPDYWNWAELGIVQPVQDQGNCGSCYAFAAIGVIESSMCRFHGVCVKLSEQEAMECTTGCRGGWDTTVYNYANSHGGCAASSFYGYLGVVRNHCDTVARPRTPASKSYNYMLLPNDAEEIRHFLYNFGPLFVAFDVYNNLFSYSSGIITTTTGNRAGGHAVLLVGYGTTNGIPYWILKNSWGSRWGERGYFRVIRGVNFARIESWKVSFAWTK